MLAVYIALFESSITIKLEEFSGKSSDSFVQINSSKESKEQINNLLTGNYNFQLDDYVVDMHTKAGREKGMNRKDFVSQGAVVSNRDSRFDNEYYKALEDIYNNLGTD
jgi:hypothetical protein